LDGEQRFPRLGEPEEQTLSSFGKKFMRHVGGLAFKSFPEKVSDAFGFQSVPPSIALLQHTASNSISVGNVFWLVLKGMPGRFFGISDIAQRLLFAGKTGICRFWASS